MFKESVKMSLQNIWSNKFRSFLTTLGIIIGVASIITLITVMQGAIDEINRQFVDLGAGTITVQSPGNKLKKGVSDDEINKIAAIDNVWGISPSLTQYSSAAYGDTVAETVLVEGRNEVYFKKNISLLGLSLGRAFNSMDMDGSSYVCIINSDLAELLFFGKEPLGESILIGGKSYKIVGVMGVGDGKDVVSMFSSMMGLEIDGKVLIPYNTALKNSGGRKVTSFEVYLDDTSKSQEVADKVENILKEAFNDKEDCYTVFNIDSLIEAMQTLQDMMMALLIGIASIALLVGGIGIMNMMLVSVTERTREIGLRKALGAEPGQIQGQFLIEAVFLSLLGGVIGLVIGLTASVMICNAMDITFVLYPVAITLGFGFSALVGVVFGWAPARKASLLNPIDALRSE